MSFPTKEDESGERSAREGAEINQMHPLPGGSSGFLLRTFSYSEKPQSKQPRCKTSPVRSAGFPSQKVLELALALCVEQLFALQQPHGIFWRSQHEFSCFTGSRPGNLIYFISHFHHVHKMISSNSGIHKIINFFFFK